MNAAEARQRALSVTEGINKTQYHDIKNYIDKAVKEGKLQTYYYENILPAVRNELEEEGFKISEYSSRNEITVTISW